MSILSSLLVLRSQFVNGTVNLSVIWKQIKESDIERVLGVCEKEKIWRKPQNNCQIRRCVHHSCSRNNLSVMVGPKYSLRMQRHFIKFEVLHVQIDLACWPSLHLSQYYRGSKYCPRTLSLMVYEDTISGLPASS